MRRFGVCAVVVAWAVGVVVLVASLGDTCPVSGSPLAPGEAQGWTLRYVFAVDQPGGRLLAERLVSRGPLAGISTEVAVSGGSGWTQRLAEAGWRAGPQEAHPAAGAPPRLEILNARADRVWAGPLPLPELAVPGSVILDEALMARVVRGEATPHLVPVGCSPTA